MKRRNFIKGAGTAVAGGMFLSYDVPALGAKISAIDKFNIGVIGCNGMGWSNTSSFLKMNDVDLVGICDVDSNVIKKRLTDYAALRKNTPKTYSDYRELLNNKDIDAVIIGTPDHWHCKIMIDACAAGKDVYCEKPVGNSIVECATMVDAQKKYNKVVQVGQWQRSNKHYADAMDFVHSGKLGNVRLVKAWAYQGWMKPVAVKPDSTPPPGVDYDMWLGPALKRPFNENRFHFNFRWFWDYAGGLMTDWGVHMINMMLMGMNNEPPKTVCSSGGKLAYPDDASETPDTLQTIYQYENFNMLWEHATGIDNGPY